MDLSHLGIGLRWKDNYCGMTTKQWEITGIIEKKKVIIYFGTCDLLVADFSGSNWFLTIIFGKRDRRVRFSYIISTSVEIIEVLC